MEAKQTNLYKISMRGWNSPAYVAADNQSEAIDKVAEAYDEEKTHFNVEYVSDIFV